MPPDRMTMYDRQPSAMAALMSDSGAGSEIGVPRVVAACRPNSSNNVPKKI